jgi:hypothetical protein
LAGAFQLQIASRYDFHFGDTPPRFQVVLGEEAASDDTSPKNGCHGFSRVSRRAGLACIIWRTSSTEKPLPQRRSAYNRMPSTGGAGGPKSVESTVSRTRVHNGPLDDLERTKLQR